VDAHARGRLSGALRNAGRGQRLLSLAAPARDGGDPRPLPRAVQGAGRAGGARSRERSGLPRLRLTGFSKSSWRRTCCAVRRSAAAVLATSPSRENARNARRNRTRAFSIWPSSGGSPRARQH
jgi:hypothetical protein